MAAEALSPDRAATIRKLLLADLGVSGLLVLIAVLLAVGDDPAGGVTTVVVAAVIGGLGWAALRSVDRGSPAARRIVVATAIVLILVSVLLVGIFVGLLTVILGVGLLAVLMAPERES
ncbi:hypothetical protein [Nocardioides aquiterrae]|uniref:Uncharacterized protein n=1 Tax=Nocardioides aquiterrae TaxID=203799 RepID=A0ABN1UH23_9ACTN